MFISCEKTQGIKTPGMVTSSGYYKYFPHLNLNIVTMGMKFMRQRLRIVLAVSLSAWYLEKNYLARSSI